MFDRTDCEIREGSTESENSKMPIEIMKSIRSIGGPFIFFVYTFWNYITYCIINGLLHTFPFLLLPECVVSIYKFNEFTPFYHFCV